MEANQVQSGDPAPQICSPPDVQVSPECAESHILLIKCHRLHLANLTMLVFITPAII